MWLWLKVKGYLAAAGIALAVIAGAFLYGRSDGKADAARAAEKANAAVRKQSKEVENEINALGDDGVDARLARWLRDGKR
ncbi:MULTISPECIES: hypothetical protein [unclassified Rhizobium]|uniref:hypothetical protein n=1 Tax=unclassified Rhizobium TaxID=2613769 RepID=UPI0009EA6983|nr:MULTISPECIES: hypothetical protein [unclassified Rhizobium]